MNDRDLTPEEREALAALPRERRPGDLLEERTVRALRAAGVLQPAVGEARRRTGGRLAVAAAAALALMAGSFAAGQWTGSRQTAGAMLALQEQNGQRVAASVQQAGTAYVTALTALARLAQARDGEELNQGREVALSALHAAADQIVRLDPDDPLAARILQALDEAATQEDAGTAAAGRRDLYWF